MFVVWQSLAFSTLKLITTDIEAASFQKLSPTGLSNVCLKNMVSEATIDSKNHLFPIERMGATSK